MMDTLFIQYPKCGTCRKAKKYLEEQGVAFADRHIVEEAPTKEELRSYLEKSGLDIRKFFNTSGQKYRELGLKDKLKSMSEEEMLDLLATDGMLVKRPILVRGSQATVGFKEEEFQKVLG
ncbi:arsenate reductase family protein [Tumebacillus sp. DT12]|uniref:Arsenate reductase family protein n=2 Tax=Tumebacillus lacus TaxID=2995335 RepID=A0ABT3X4V5_9BACL|nr:arsenate reductase family protein [Tumebacillus lacus]MCX7569764.1 arsenate reductase family protein [Tumebacillus lacus]